MGGIRLMPKRLDNGEDSTTNSVKYPPKLDNNNKDASYKGRRALISCQGSSLAANGRSKLKTGKPWRQSRKQNAKSDVSSATTGISSNVVAKYDGALIGNVFSSIRACKLCKSFDSALNMLHCDHCEEAFHFSCCVPEVKRINFDEWYCKDCKKKQREPVFGVTKQGKSPSFLQGTSDDKKRVRIGAAFQAEVPEWSGPVISDSDGYYDEPEELDVTGSRRSDEKKPIIVSKEKSRSNWLQCQEVLSENEGGEKVICGKWRWAPPYEVQTAEWTCYDSVKWDRTRSDCAVPQELSTEEVKKLMRATLQVKDKSKSKKRKVPKAVEGSNGGKQKVQRGRTDLMVHCR